MSRSSDKVVPYPSSPAGSPADDQLDAYLHHLLLCLRRYVANYGHRMLQASGSLSDLFVSLNEARTTLELNPQTSLAEHERLVEGWPTPDAAQRDVEAHAATLAARAEGWREAGRDGSLPLENLRQLFHLEERQMLLLMAAAAPLIAVDVARLYTFAWADFAIKSPTVGFLTELVAATSREARELVSELRGDSPLIRYRLLDLEDTSAWGTRTPLLHRSVRVPDRLVAYLQRHAEPLSPNIADTCQVTGPAVALPRDQLVLPGKVVGELAVALGEAVASGRGRPRLLLIGSAGSGRRTAAATLLAPRGWGVLTADLLQLSHEGERFEESLVEICREALLRRCLLLIRADAVLVDRDLLAKLSRPLGRVLEPYEGPLALAASLRAPQVHRLVSGLFEVSLPLPNSAQQRALWRRAVAEAGCTVAAETAELLTQRFSVSPGSIHAAVAEARAREALFHGSSAVELSAVELGRAIRRRTVHALGAIAEPFTTSLDWDDVVLPDNVMTSLREVLSHARHHERVFEEWGFAKKVPYGRGLSCLFSGPPGTGKTMMAAVLAKSLGRELYRVDLSRVVSKWVGETEKNLALAFDEAERGQLILLFDEADALFSERTKTQTSNDRFANMEINYLLQRMEAFDGITILTTNKEKGIDEAFKRRIKFKITFPMPDAKLRERLWRSMLTAELRVEADVPFDYLGTEFEMAGGNIKNAVVRAAFYAADSEGVLTAQHLFDAARQEAREMGRVVRDKTLEQELGAEPAGDETSLPPAHGSD